MKIITNLFNRIFKHFHDPCECGNPIRCTGKYRFFVLYDITDRGGVRPNKKRISRCTQFQDNRKQTLEKLKVFWEWYKE